jgi:hypothetical protein
MWDNTSWWAYHAADIDTPHQLMPSMKTSYVLYQAPRLGGSDDTIIPHRLEEEGLGCLYSTKNIFFIARRFSRDKIYWKPCKTTPCSRPTIL